MFFRVHQYLWESVCLLGKKLQCKLVSAYTSISLHDFYVGTSIYFVMVFRNWYKYLFLPISTGGAGKFMK